MPQCPACKSSFAVREEDLAFYQKFEVPPPSLCADCRMQQRMTFRNERTLYKRKSNFSGKDIISIYGPESPYPIYSPEEWWSDKWEGIDYGREIDFSRPFFEQFYELAQEVPRISLFNVNPYNSDYCQQAYNNKNCYLCVVVKDCKDSMYVSHANRLTDCYDCSHVQDCELCYDCLDSEKLYESVGCRSCQNGSDLYFCVDCIGCHHCIGCTGLRNKHYYVENKQVSEEDYQKYLKELCLSSFAAFGDAKSYFQEYFEKSIQRENRNINTHDCLGNYLINSKNSYYCFDAFQIEDCGYSTWIFESRDCHDIYGMGTSELVYSSVGVENLHSSAFNTFVSDSNNSFYSDLCFSCSDIFGCVSLQRQKNCIFNKSYSREEYQNLRSKLIEHMRETGEWGSFFPSALSPFAYNETVAQEYFPLTKEEAKNRSFHWQELDKKESQPQERELADDIKDSSLEVTKEIFACKSCRKNYRILPAELKFYQKLGLPIPRECMDCRYMQRAWSRTPAKLWERVCADCNKGIVTSYAPARPETVFCESCYAEHID